MQESERTEKFFHLLPLSADGIRSPLHVIGMGDNVVDYNVTLGRYFPGGNSVNFAIFVRQLGFNSSFLGVIGDDIEGNLIRDTLKKENVDVRYLISKKGETGKCLIKLNKGDRIISDINDFGVVRTDPFIITDEIIQFIKSADLVHSGCYGCMLPELHKINKIGVPILFDYSDKWTEEKLVEIAEFATFLLFSGRNCSQIFLEDLIRRVVGIGRLKLVICTRGENGALVYDGNEMYSTKSFAAGKVIVDSTAAGDAFASGFFTTYLLGIKQFERFQWNPEIQKYWEISVFDKRSFVSSLIKHAMNIGNVLALYTCMHEGSFGKGEIIINN